MPAAAAMASGAGQLAASASGWVQAGGSGSSSLACLLPLRHQLAAGASPRPACSRRSIVAAASQQQEPSQVAAAVDSAAAACASAAAGADAGSAAQPLPSRLQREVDALVGLDVEYTHLRLPGGPRLGWHLASFPYAHPPSCPGDAGCAGDELATRGANRYCCVACPLATQMAATSACQLRCVQWTQPAECCFTRTSIRWVRALALWNTAVATVSADACQHSAFLHAAHAPRIGYCCESAASPPAHSPAHSAPPH